MKELQAYLGLADNSCVKGPGRQGVRGALKNSSIHFHRSITIKERRSTIAVLSKQTRSRRPRPTSSPDFETVFSLRPQACISPQQLKTDTKKMSRPRKRRKNERAEEEEEGEEEEKEDGLSFISCSARTLWHIVSGLPVEHLIWGHYYAHVILFSTS